MLETIKLNSSNVSYINDNKGAIPCFTLVNSAPKYLIDKVVGKHKIQKK